MKQQLLEILNNPANKLIAVDMDGTLCEGKFWKETCTPMVDRIEYVNSLYNKGAHIIIWTARTPEWFVETNRWLAEHGVKFHGISMGRKIGADVYIDDKALNVSDLPINQEDETA